MTPQKPGADKILVIEDDRHISELLSTTLARERFTPIVAQDGGIGLNEARRLLPSLILLDLMLPTMDGWEVCRRLRAEEKTRDIPIIMVTAKGDEEDRVAGLELGADDYMAKPFSTRELVARIRALLRRKAGHATNTAGLLRVGALEIDPDRHVITVNGTPFHLTMMEFAILQRLAQEPGRVFTRDQLLTFLWGEDCYVQQHNLDVHIHAIRKKIEADPGQPLYVQTVRGIGYRLRDPNCA
ncbi:MAG TPA: response regulator transcription factor [Nitrospirales bacterium]|nr:response regulator transcription factor [Nitrospirales bacterium]